MHLILPLMIAPLLPHGEHHTQDPKPYNTKVSFRSISTKSSTQLKHRPKTDTVKKETQDSHQEKERLRQLMAQHQVVDIPPTTDDSIPEDAKFLSEHNTRTLKETVSRHTDIHAENVMNERTVSAVVQPIRGNPRLTQLNISTLPQEKSPLPEEPTQKVVTGLVFSLPERAAKQQLRLTTDASLGRFYNHQEQALQKGNKDHFDIKIPPSKNPLKAQKRAAQSMGIADPTLGTDLTLIPSVGILAKLSGAAFGEVIDDIEKGEGTFLNSREFKYGSYINRVKREIAKQWHPVNTMRWHDPSGQVYGVGSFSTLFQVTLHSDGRIKTLKILHGSGVSALDSEARNAVVKAAPFHNPPEGMKDAQGLISFPFGFRFSNHL